MSPGCASGPEQQRYRGLQLGGGSNHHALSDHQVSTELGTYKQCFGSALVLMRIRIQHFRSMRIRIQKTKNWENINSWKNCVLWWKIAINYSWASIKDVQATVEAFTPKKRTSSTSKHEISELFLFLWVFCPPGSGSGPSRPKSMRIRIRNTGYKRPFLIKRIWIRYKSRSHEEILTKFVRFLWAGFCHKRGFSPDLRFPSAIGLAYLSTFVYN
jgi:hypothetical protein